MQHTPVLDAKGKATGIYAYNGHVANRAIELIGKELGMLVDRSNITNQGDLVERLQAGRERTAKARS